MEPKISVIVPFYKTTELQLRLCIDSVLKQSFSDLELLVIDDGSPLDHSALLHAYEKQDPRVTYVRQDNAGVSAARNRGLEMARGEFVAFLDSDDYWDSGFLYTMLDAIQDYDLVICGLDNQRYDTCDNTVDRHVFFSFPSWFSPIQYTNFVLNKLFRTRIIREHHLTFPLNVKLGEDAIFLGGYLRHCKTIRSIPQALYHYIANETSAVHSFQRQFWTDEEQLIHLQWELFHQYPLNAVEHAFLQYWLYHKLRMLMFYYLSKETDPALLDQTLHSIISAPCFQPLLSPDVAVDHYFFKKPERRELRQLRAHGVAGAVRIYRQEQLHEKLEKLKIILLK